MPIGLIPVDCLSEAQIEEIAGCGITPLALAILTRIKPDAQEQLIRRALLYSHWTGNVRITADNILAALRDISL